VYQKEIFQQLEPGMKLTAYVRQVREDGKIDLALQKDGKQKVDDFSSVLLDYIKEQGGYTSLNDKSAAEDIYEVFGVSKKTFKKAVGDLYKRRLILLVENGIRLV
jgi:predicted RNA-binding protein (virulence factor B family)